MYTRRIRLANYGPYSKLDLEFPFADGRPKPIVLVGENGSGKSILLSQIVNGLINAKDVVFPGTPEVEPGKVYKVRSSSYIKTGGEYYYIRVDFERQMFVREMRLLKPISEFDAVPPELIDLDGGDLWSAMGADAVDRFITSFSDQSRTNVKALFDNNCALYFPANRFEEPAWLNEDNLNARAEYTDLPHAEGSTKRKIIDYSPLQENQNWLFDLIYDRAVFELQTANWSVPMSDIALPVLVGYSGNAASLYNAALRMVRLVTNRERARFGIGKRNNRVVSLESDAAGQIVPNIFQLSSGETSLLNLFLSILRDFDLCGVPFTNASDIRGIVVVDEIDLHLHANHQHEILPKLIQMFPQVQFVITTHSPLFVLGMQRAFGDDGFALFHLPQGQQISPEEFSEFGDAYASFSTTRRFLGQIRTEIDKAQKPVMLMEGATDIAYLERASDLLEKRPLLESFEIRDGGGGGNLVNIWKGLRHPLTDLMSQKVLLVFDCDKKRADENRGNLFQRTLPCLLDHPVNKGIENLFGKATLAKACQHRSAIFDIEHEHGGTKGGSEIVIPERWTLNDKEKTNLCTWLCNNGTQDDFRHFLVVFDLMREVLNSKTPRRTVDESEVTK